MGVYKTVKGGHGMMGSGSGHPKTMGVTGPGGSFVGTKMAMDGDRTSVTDKEQVGEVGSKKVPKGVGIKKLNTGGMSRRNSGASGIGAFKAKGTN